MDVFKSPFSKFLQNSTHLVWHSQQLQKLDLLLLAENFPQFTFSTSVRDLGVTLDSTLTFSEHITQLTRSSYFQL